MSPALNPLTMGITPDLGSTLAQLAYRVNLVEVPGLEILGLLLIELLVDIARAPNSHGTGKACL